MIKYTILYKNGKTCNGKAKRLHDLTKPAKDAVLLWGKGESGSSVYVPGACSPWVGVPGTFIGKKAKRTPNPKSKTKKQKAFDEAFQVWIEENHPKCHPYSRGMWLSDYKKWLYEQRKANSIKCFPSLSIGDRIGYYPSDSDELVWCTITESGYTSPDTIKVKAMMPGEIDKAITQIRLSYEEPNDGWITWNGGEMPVPKGTMVHVKYRDGVETICSAGIMGWEEGFEGNVDGRSAVNWKHPHNSIWDIVAYKLYEDPKKVTFIKPIKTPYTFWLGAFGEIND